MENTEKGDRVMTMEDRELIKADLMLEIEEEFDDRVASAVKQALAGVQAANVTVADSSKGTEELAQSIARAIAEAGKTDLYKRSRQRFVPVPDDEIKTPLNYNILNAASAMALSKGHSLGPWRKNRVENVSPLVESPPEDYMAVCRTCGKHARAFWAPPVVRDEQKLWTPVFQGGAIMSHEGGPVSMDQSFHNAFPRVQPSMTGGKGAGFTTSAVERPEGAS